MCWNSNHRLNVPGVINPALSDEERARRWLRDYDGAETVEPLAALLAEVRRDERDRAHVGERNAYVMGRDAGVLAEREACARTAESCSPAGLSDVWTAAQRSIAAAIRRRGDNPVERGRLVSAVDVTESK